MKFHLAAMLGVAVVLLGAMITLVDLAPQVEANFFFAEDDPQLLRSSEIGRRFPSNAQIIVRVAGDVHAASYRARIDALTQALRAVDSVVQVSSITTVDAFNGPLWGRVLLSPNSQASNVVVEVLPGDDSRLVTDVETIIAAHDTPDVSLAVSGVPYVLEHIRRNLLRDLIVFSGASIVVFGLIFGLVYRRLMIVVGSMTCCMAACSATLLLTQLLSIAIGLLTANLATIVFVLTLSHVVFLTSNWKAAAHPDGVREAVRLTLPASILCMLTTMLGFASLLLASARPLRELGVAGAIGSVTALVVAYTMYPVFLRSIPRRGAAPGSGIALPGRVGLPWVIASVGIFVLLALGIPRLSTDPSLLSYFPTGTPLRDGLELIDRDGGSSPLSLIVGLPGESRLDTDEGVAQLEELDKAMQEDGAVGVVISPASFLAEVRRAPLVSLLSYQLLLQIPPVSRLADAFFDDTRREGLFILRMREGGRSEAREDIVRRLESTVVHNGFEPRLVGGLFELQSQLGLLIRSSLQVGVVGLFVVFLGMGVALTRAIRPTAALGFALVAIPVTVIGVFGHANIALDIISSPAANVALAMGVDSMIHIVVRVTRLQRAGVPAGESWWKARDQLAAPVLGAVLVICGGFGIFGLSSFPPTQRFGLAVILGTMTAGYASMVLLPALAATRSR